VACLGADECAVRLHGSAIQGVGVSVQAQRGSRINAWFQGSAEGAQSLQAEGDELGGEAHLLIRGGAVRGKRLMRGLPSRLYVAPRLGQEQRRQKADDLLQGGLGNRLHERHLRLRGLHSYWFDNILSRTKYELPSACRIAVRLTVSGDCRDHGRFLPCTAPRPRP
jgi:hypothetical protein